MVLYRQPRENDPPGRIFHKPFRFVDIVFPRILDFQRLISMIHPRGSAKEYRRSIFFREVKSFLDHLISFTHGRRVKDRHFGKHCKRARILLCLGRDRTGVIRHKHDHAALHADVLQTHKGIGSHVQSDLLHGDQRPRACIGRACSHFHACLLIDRPLHINIAGVPLRDRLQHLRRRCPRISRDQVHSCRQGAESDGFISHQKLFMHCYYLFIASFL